MYYKHPRQPRRTAQTNRPVIAAIVLAAVWLLGNAAFDSDAQPVSVSLTPKPSGLPGDLRMSWTGVPDSTYLIQTSTNLNGPGNWDTFDAVTASNSSVLYDISPGAGANADPFRFYRLVLPQPQITSVEPTFINSSDSNAVLYILGQLLPTNATVVIDGQDFTPVIINSNGVWASVSLTNLPPGTVISGQISVINSALGTTVATLPVQSPIIYGTTPSNEQLQGPPEDDPPASAYVGQGQGDTLASPALKLGTANGGVEQAGSGNACVGLINDVGHSIQSFVLDGTRSHDAQCVWSGGHGGGDNNGGGIGEPGIAASDEAQTADKGIKKRHHTMALGNGDGGGRGPDSSAIGIQMATGEVTVSDMDLAVPGLGMSFAWVRTYRSLTGPTTAQGTRWDFSYNVSIAVQGNGTVTLATGDGRTETFYPNGNNTWARDEYFVQVSDLNGDGMPDVLFPDGGKWLFNPLGTAAAGKLASIVDRNGNTITLSYDVSGRLTTIVDTLNRTNTVAYNTGGMIASVTDFSGRTVSYSYDGNNDLVQCVSPAVTGTPNGNDFPGGKTNFYTYTSGFSDNGLNHNLTTASHEMGHNWGMSHDPSSPAVTSVSYGPYVEQFTRFPLTPSPANGFATIEAIFCDPVGNVSEYYYDSHERCVDELDYTGRSDPTQPVTPTSNRPVEKLRSTDPDFFETLWKWNPDSLCSSVIVVDDQTQQPRVTILDHERDFNQSATPRDKGNLRVIRDLPNSAVDTSGNGTADTTERTWHFDYDPRFGSPDREVWRQDFGQVKADRHSECKAATKGGGGHTGNMCGNHKDCMMAVAHDGGGGGDSDGGLAMTSSSTGHYLRKKLPGKMKSGAFIADPGSTGGGDSGGGRMRPVPALMRARERGQMTAYVPDTDGNGGLDRLNGAFTCTFVNGRYELKAGIPLSTMFGDGTGRINRVRFACARKWSGNIVLKRGVTFDPGDVNNDGFPDFCISATDPDGNSGKGNYDPSGNMLQWTLTVRVQRVEMAMAYNPHGQVTAITNVGDANAYTSVDTYAYYNSGPQNGYLQSATSDTYGLAITTSYGYDARGNLTRLVDPRGNDSLYTYNTLDQLVESQTPTNITARCTSQYFYDANDNLVQSSTELRDIGDNLDRTIIDQYTYDPLNRCSTVVLAGDVNHTLTIGFGYDGNGNTTAVYSPMAMSGADTNSFVSFQYDERDFLFRKVDAPSNAATALTNQWNYDVNGDCITLTITSAKAQTETVAFAYDGFDRCVSVTDALGNSETAAYDRCDNLMVERSYEPGGAAGNQLLAQCSYQYDQLYRPVSVQQARFDSAGNPIGVGYALTTIAYAPNSQVVSITDDNQHTTSYSYDTVGRCVQVTDAKNDLLQCAFDACGNATNELAFDRPDGTTTTQRFSMAYAYDSQNRCLTRTDNVGNTSSCAYDSLDRIIQQTDANGNLTGWAYDDLGRCTETVADLDKDGVLDFALDARNIFTYDDNSRCVAVTDANTNTTLYAYDSLGRCLTISNADNTTSQFTYDALGNLLTSTDPNGTTVTNHYDSLNRIVHRDIAARNVTVASTTFENFAYDGLSRLISASNDISGSTFAYDSLGDCTGTSQDGLVSSLSYDGVGNLLSATYPSGRVVNYTYDALDQVTSLASGASGLAPTTYAQYFYAGPGRLTKTARKNVTLTFLDYSGIAGAGNSTGDFGWGEVASVRHLANSGKTVIDEREFAYDHSQNKISRIQIAPFTPGGPTLTNGFSYDAVNRLTAFTHLSGATNDYSLSYVMDDNRVRKLETINGVSAPYTLNSAIPPGDFEMNRYTVTPFGSQTYDANGNMTGFTSTTQSVAYGYDYANRLVEVTDLGAGTTIATFGYDALGRRISKTTSTNVSTEFAVLRQRFLVEAYQGGKLTESYAYGDVNGDGVEDVAVSFNAAGTPTYYHSDELGNVLALTDPQGNVLERTDYGDCGQPTFLASDGSVLTGPMGQPLASSPRGNPFQFQGMFWDGETGLYLVGRKHIAPVKWENVAEPPDYLNPQIGRVINNTAAFDQTTWSACGIAFERGESHRPYVTFAGSESYTFSGGNPWSPAGAKKKSSGGFCVMKIRDMASP